LPRRSAPGQPDTLLNDLRSLLIQFEARLADVDLRLKVQALVPAVHKIRDLGSSLIPIELAESAQQRILMYFRKYQRRVIHGDELMVVAGISEWARRVRELRVEFGWKIVSGTTVIEMFHQEELNSSLDGESLDKMGPDDYILLNPEQDLESAYRWNLANSIRKTPDSVRNKILTYLRANVGKSVSGEELRYVAGNRSEWARRVRELRTEFGWPIATKQTGRPDLEVGEYVLEVDRQGHRHDRRIPDPVRREVLTRDEHRCVICGWSQSEWSTEDPRFIELHHLIPHVEKGENVEENLEVLCNVCHNDKHRELKHSE